MKNIILLASLSSLLLGCAGQVNEQDTSNNSDNTTINSEQSRRRKRNRILPQHCPKFYINFRKRYYK